MSAPESSRAFRRSGTFNPSKPCTSSSSKSKSTSPSPRASFEYKENEGDPNCSMPERTRFSLMNEAKGMKSFMAPTVSASSKITAASPRKKVLVEKNEDSLKSQSVSVKGVRVEEISPKSEMGFDSEEMSGRNRSRKLDFSSSMSQYQSAYTHFPSCFGSEEMSGENRSRKLDFSSSKSYHQSTPTHSTSICLDDAPLDADPSLPPYDPITNYLSPRPLFLHYKPRIELNPEFMEDLLYERDGRRLEESFSDSEGSVDCSGYTVEEQSSPLKKESDHEPFPTVMKTQEARPDETHVSEVRPETYKPRTMSFQRPKLIPFLLFFSIVSSCVLLTDSPIFYPSMMRDKYFAGPRTLSLHDICQKGYLAAASRNLQGLATRMRQWPIDSIASLNSSSSFSKQELDTSHSVNMTLSSSMDENIGLDFCYRSELVLAGNKKKIDGQIHPLDNMNNEFEHDSTAGEALGSYNRGDAEKIIFKHSEDANKKGTGEETVWIKYEEGLNSFTDPVVDFGTMIKYDQTNKIDFAVSEEVNREDYSSGFKLEQMLEKQVLIGLGQHDINSSVDAAVVSQIMSKEDANGDGTGDEMVWKGKDDNFPKWRILNSLTDSVIELTTTNKNHQPEGIDIANSEKVDKEGYRMGFGTGRKLDEQVLIELGQEVNHPRKKEVIDSCVDPVVESQMMKQNDVGALLVNFLTGIQPSIFADTKLMLAALGVFSAVALATTLALIFTKQKQSPAASKDKCRNKRIGSIFGGTKSCRHANGSSYVKLTGVMEVVGDSGPTEMSSSFDNSKQRSKIGGQEVTPIHEIMQRESGVSSTISYGSFTTFEKVSAKKGNKTEEVITPVRRSSRVRKQITSP